MRSFYVCRNDRDVKFNGKQGCPAFECLHLPVLGPSAFGIKDKAAAGLLHELPAGFKTGRKRFSSRAAIDGYDIHQRRDRPAHAAGAKEIVAGSDKSEAAKAAPARGHQDRTVGMTAVIAAKQKRAVRKMMALLHNEGAIPPEECTAKTLETQTAQR